MKEKRNCRNIRDSKEKQKERWQRQKKGPGKEWYAKLDNIDGEDQIYRIARAEQDRRRTSPRWQESKTSWDSIVTEDKVRERWQEYFIKLLNIENGSERLPKINIVQGLV